MLYICKSVYLNEWMYAWIKACMYLRTSVCTYLCNHECTYANVQVKCVCMYIWMKVHTSDCMYNFMHEGMNEWMYVWNYVNMYVCSTYKLKNEVIKTTLESLQISVGGRGPVSEVLVPVKKPVCFMQITALMVIHLWELKRCFIHKLFLRPDSGPRTDLPVNQWEHRYTPLPAASNMMTSVNRWSREYLLSRAPTTIAIR